MRRVTVFGFSYINHTESSVPMSKHQDEDVLVYVKETFLANVYHVAVFVIPACLMVTSSLTLNNTVSQLSL